MALLSADSSNITESTCLNLKCFCESFTGIFSDPDHLGDLPESNKPTDGIGIMINLMGKRRWRPFATWIIKLLSRCLTEGTLYVEGLIHGSFVSAACSLICYGDADLQMVGGKSYEFLLLVYHSTCELVDAIVGLILSHFVYICDSWYPYNTVA